MEFLSSFWRLFKNRSTSRKVSFTRKFPSRRLLRLETLEKRNLLSVDLNGGALDVDNTCSNLEVFDFATCTTASCASAISENDVVNSKISYSCSSTPTDNVLEIDDYVDSLSSIEIQRVTADNNEEPTALDSELYTTDLDPNDVARLVVFYSSDAVDFDPDSYDFDNPDICFVNVSSGNFHNEAELLTTQSSGGNVSAGSLTYATDSEILESNVLSDNEESDNDDEAENSSSTFFSFQTPIVPPGYQGFLEFHSGGKINGEYYATYGSDYYIANSSNGTPSGVNGSAVSGGSTYFIIPVNNEVIEARENVEIRFYLQENSGGRIYAETPLIVTIVDDDVLTLRSASFTNNLDLCSDTNGSSGTSLAFGASWQIGPHWFNSQPELTLPIAYSCSDSLSCRGCLEEFRFRIDQNVEVFVRIKYNDSTFSNWQEVSTASTTYELALETTFADILNGRKAYYDSDFSLDWEFKINDEIEKVFACTENPLYVTYSTPVSNAPLFHTAVHMSCSAACGVGGSEENVFNSIWNKFATLSIPKVNLSNGQVCEGETLSYYGKTIEDSSHEADVKSNLAVVDDGDGDEYYLIQQQASRAREVDLSNSHDGFFLGTLLSIDDSYWAGASLLRYLDGTCEAWQSFAKNVFGCQGITVISRDVSLTQSLTGDTVQRAFQVKTNIRGQGDLVPYENIWSNHALVQYNNRIFDPAYGVSYGTLDVAKQNFISIVNSIGTVGTPGTSVDWSYCGYGLLYTPTETDLDITIDDFSFSWDSDNDNNSNNQ